jgi:hypothetical protein
MHAHLIAAGSPNGWQYATESWSKGGVVLGLAILFVLVAVVTAVVKAS